MLKITPFSKNKKVERLLKEWPERIDAIVKEMAFSTAEDILDNIKALAPTDIDGYPQMLDIVDYGKVDEFDVFGIVPPEFTFTQFVISMDIQRTVLYVLPKVSKGLPVSEAAALLAEYNPWTMKTLPWEPTTKQADILSRKVSLKEVQVIEYEIEKSISEVKNRLKELGITSFRESVRTLRREKLIRDLAFEIIRREFGIAPERGVAHWRPAVRQASTVDANRNFKKLYKWFSMPDNYEWKNVGRAKKSSSRIATVVKKVARFQQLVSPKT